MGGSRGGGCSQKAAGVGGDIYIRKGNSTAEERELLT